MARPGNGNHGERGNQNQVFCSRGLRFTTRPVRYLGHGRVHTNCTQSAVTTHHATAFVLLMTQTHTDTQLARKTIPRQKKTSRQGCSFLASPSTDPAAVGSNLRIISLAACLLTGCVCVCVCGGGGRVRGDAGVGACAHTPVCVCVCVCVCVFN